MHVLGMLILARMADSLGKHRLHPIGLDLGCGGNDLA